MSLYNPLIAEPNQGDQRHLSLVVVTIASNRIMILLDLAIACQHHLLDAGF